MAPPDLTDPAVVSGFVDTMQTRLPEFEYNPHIEFLHDKLEEELQTDSTSVPGLFSASGIDWVPSLSSVSNVASDHKWRSKAPRNFEEAEKIQLALLPAIEDYAAYTKESVPEWKEGKPQTIWLSYDEQHAMLQRSAHLVWNKKNARIDARKLFQLRHHKAGHLLRDDKAPIVRLKPEVVMSEDGREQTSSVLDSPATDTAAVVREASAAIVAYWAAIPEDQRVLPVPTIRSIEIAMVNTHRAAIEASAKVLSLYPEVFTVWLVTRAISFYNRRGTRSISWETWCKIVAPIIFVEELAIKNPNRLPPNLRPIWHRRGPTMVTLEEARKGHEVWKATRHVDRLAAKICYPAFKPYRNMAQEIMSDWQESQGKEDTLGGEGPAAALSTTDNDETASSLHQLRASTGTKEGTYRVSNKTLKAGAGFMMKPR
ncbi:MAG: hypothetical protein Q9163_001305 [Psora crenata]